MDPPETPVRSPLTKSHSTSSIILGPISTSPGSPIPRSLAFLKPKRRQSDNDAGAASTPITHRLVRKKSGELVKSSLKLNCMQRGNSRSMPTTPTYNKSVHFGPQVDVRYFDKGDRPTALSADASPILRPRSDDTGVDYFSFRGLAHGFRSIDDTYASTFDDDSDNDDYNNDDDDNDNDDDDDDDNDDNENNVNINHNHKNAKQMIWELESVNFGKIKYNEKFVNDCKVFLEFIKINDHQDSIIGNIAAKNLSFEKSIHVRYTFDQWRTVLEVEAKFISEIPRILKRSHYDRFEFKIDLKNFKRQDQTKILFCIRYKYNEGEIWDNNDHKNYEILIKRTLKRYITNNGTTHNEEPALSKHQEKLDKSFVPPPHLKEIEGRSFTANNPYFSDYSFLNSPDTPKVLKNTDNLLDTPNFNDLHPFNTTDELNGADFSNAIDKLSLFSDNSNLNLLNYEENNNSTDKNNGHSTATNDNQENQENQENQHTPRKLKELQGEGKPKINSKTYQELLDSYCFFKGSPTTISSYLEE